MLKVKAIQSCFFMLMAMSLSLNAQVRFQGIASVSGIYTADRVFQFSLLNTSPQSVNGQVFIKLTNLRGDLVAQYQSVPTPLKPLESVSGLQLDWLKSIEFGSTQAAIQFREQGVLPYGQYVVCYTFSDGKTRTSPSCSEIDSKPQVPPQLNYPADKEIILTTTPLLTWIPPMPDFGTVFQYNIRLVERQSNQSCAQALAQNTPIVAESGQEETVYLMTDARGLGLEIGKTYCWQVGASTKSNPLGNTDIWQFTVGNAAPPPVIVNNEPYILLKQGTDAECVHVVNGSLRIAFNNRFYVPTLNYILRKEEATSVAVTPKSYVLALNAGMNYIDIPLSNNVTTRNQPYVLELMDENNIKYYCRFVYEN